MQRLTRVTQTFCEAASATLRMRYFMGFLMMNGRSMRAPLVFCGKKQSFILQIPGDCTIFATANSEWSDARVAEEARLESVYTPKGYREFESRSLRKTLKSSRNPAGSSACGILVYSSAWALSNGYKSVLGSGFGDFLALEKDFWVCFILTPPPTAPRPIRCAAGEDKNDFWVCFILTPPPTAPRPIRCAAEEDKKDFWVVLF